MVLHPAKQVPSNGGRPPESEIAALTGRLRSAIKWVQQAGEVEICRDNDAEKLWAEVYPKLSDGHPGLLGAATSRAEAQGLRLSAIFAIFDCSVTVRVEHISAALAVWDYCLASARYIFGDATGDPVADRIREGLADAGGMV